MDETKRKGQEIGTSRQGPPKILGNDSGNFATTERLDVIAKAHSQAWGLRPDPVRDFQDMYTHNTEPLPWGGNTGLEVPIEHSAGDIYDCPGWPHPEEQHERQGGAK